MTVSLKAMTLLLTTALLVSGLRAGAGLRKSGFKMSVASQSSASSVAADYAENIMNTYGRYPLTISHGKGTRIYDTEGKEYLDFASGIATCCLVETHLLPSYILQPLDYISWMRLV